MNIAEKLTQIAENEQKVYEAGYGKGYNDGNTLYYASTLTELYANCIFPENYNLVLRIKSPTGLSGTFRGTENLKSVKIIAENRTNNLQIQNMFRENYFIETVDLTEFSCRISKCDYAFYQATALKRILGALDLSAVTATTNYDFYANGLEEVEFVPNTIFKSTRFTSTKLTQASVDSIVNGLADLTGQTSQKIQLPSNILLMLSVEQLESITAKNWTT